MRRMRRFWRFLLVVGVVTSVGCGSSSNGDGAGTSSSTSVPSTTSTSSTTPPSSTTTAGAGRAELAVSGDGLVFVIGTRTDRLDFGATDEATAKTALQKALGGPQDVTTAQPCEDGSGDSFDVVTYPAVAASFVAGKLVGWESRSAGVTTVDGIGVGSTLDDLRGAYGDLQVDPESSLGVEWSVGDGDPRGLLSENAPDGRVEAMWAGHVCIIR